MVRTRAAIVGSLGPAALLLGLSWTLCWLLLSDPALTARNLAFAPAQQLIAVGFIITLICTPVALEISRAQPRDLDIPDFDKSLRPRPDFESPRRRRLARRY